MAMPLIDETVMADWCMDLDPEDVAAILERVPDQTRACIDDIEAAVAQGEFDRAKRVAHKLKGMSANLGAARLSSMARQIEMECGGLDDLKARLPLLKGTATETLAALATRN